MHINLFIIPFVIILGLLMGANDTQQHRKWYIFLCSAVLLFVAAMRSPEYMTNTYHIDTLSYRWSFENSFDIGWNQFWLSAYQRYFGTKESEYDIGFIALNKIIGWFTHDFCIYSLIADLIFFIPLGIILYRYCTSMRQLIFAFVFYIALVQIFLLAGARQIIAVGFDLIALLSVIDRKKWKAMLFFVLGLTIHFSSFLFLIPLLMVWYDTKPRTLKLVHVICFVLFPIVLVFPNQIIVLMGEASGVERYAKYGMGEIRGGASTFIFLIESLSIFCLMAIKRSDLQINHSMRVFYVMIPLFTLLAPLVRSSGSMVRISLYYHLYLTLLVPFAIDCMFKEENRRIVYAVAIVALAFMTLKGGGIRYYFFWQV